MKQDRFFYMWTPLHKDNMGLMWIWIIITYRKKGFTLYNSKDILANPKLQRDDETQIKLQKNLNENHEMCLWLNANWPHNQNRNVTSNKLYKLHLFLIIIRPWCAILLWYAWFGNRKGIQQAKRYRFNTRSD